MKNKIIRTITSLLPVEEGRTGSCNNCGACCHLPFRCAFLKTAEDNKEYCSIYTVRPPNCRKFPRTSEEHKLVQNECGFSFEAKTISPPQTLRSISTNHKKGSIE